jgi:hypothetical protein
MAGDTEQPLLQDSGREPEAHEAECTGGEKLAFCVVVSHLSMPAASDVTLALFHPILACATCRQPGVFCRYHGPQDSHG